MERLGSKCVDLRERKGGPFIYIALIIFPLQAMAANFAVNSFTDATDLLPGDGVCRTAANECTLRAAIIEANVFPGTDSISFLINGTFPLSLPGANEDHSLRGDLDILQDVTIQGNGSSKTIIAGGGIAVRDRVFHVDPLAMGVKVRISNVTVQNGDVSGDGGGILVVGKGNLFLTRTIVKSNRSTQCGGIAIWSPYAAAALAEVIIADNQATSGTGGIGNQGTLDMLDVSVRGNSADGYTGGVFIGGVARLVNVTVSGNTAHGLGGGVFPGGMMLGGNTTLINSTISGNWGDPGGVWNGGRTAFTNVTLTGNTGGIQNCDNCGARIEVRNTIVADSAFVSNLNCYGKITSLGHNLDSGNACGFTRPGDVVNANPLLGQLAKNGGRTETHAPAVASPVIDAGNSVGCPSRDQHGVARPQGQGCDIGAFELQTEAFVVNSNADGLDVTPGDGICETTRRRECTLRAAIMEANALRGPNIIRFGIAGVFALSITGAGEDASHTGDLDVRDDLTILGNGSTNTVIEGTRAFSDRILDLDPAGTGITVSLSNATLRRGNALGVGGGILVGEAAALTMTQVVLSENRVSGTLANGGAGIWSGGELLLQHCEIRENVAAASTSSVAYGGGIVSAGMATVSDSVIAHNASTEQGGGLWTGVNSTTILTRSAIYDNRADSRGGGVYNRGKLTVTDSWIADNTSGAYGGGIHNLAPGIAYLARATMAGNSTGLWGSAIMDSGEIHPQNVTVSGNSGGPALMLTRQATVSATTIARNIGGGIATTPIGSNVKVEGTIVSDSMGAANCSGIITSGGRNLDSGTSCGFMSKGDLVATSPLLAPLALNGGNTRTHALLGGSPAVDAADTIGCPSTDQRGIKRPQGKACDIGAYEAP